MWETAGSFFFFLCHFLVYFEESPVEKQCSSETASVILSVLSQGPKLSRQGRWEPHYSSQLFKSSPEQKKKKKNCPDYSYTWEHLSSLETQHFQFLCYWLSEVTQLGSIGQVRVQVLSEGNRALGTLGPVLHWALLSLHSQCSSSTHWISTSHPRWFYLQSSAAKSTSSSFSTRKLQKHCPSRHISYLHNLSFSWLEHKVAFLS